MQINCLLPEVVDKFKKAISDGKIDPDDLLVKASRLEILESIVGKENLHDVNAFFESKILLVNQKQGIINAVKKMSGIDTRNKETLLKNAQIKLDRITEYMDPAKEDKFLADLAQEQVNKKYKLYISPEETKYIVEATKSIEEAKSKIEIGVTPEKSPIRLDYGLKQRLLNKYIGELKMNAGKLSFIEYLKKPSRWLGDSVNLVSGTLKSAVASLDNSFFGRQGIKVLYTNPDIWAKDFGKSFIDIGKQLFAKGKIWTSGNDAATDMIYADVLSRDNALNGKYKATGVDINLATEEAFPTSLPEVIPLFGRLFKASEVAYNGAAIRMRADLADRVIAGAEKYGVDVLNDETNIGGLVNSMTGRGNLGKLEPMGKELNVLLFSIKFLKSNIDTLYDGLTGLPKILSKAPEDFVARQNALNLLKMITFISGILGTAGVLYPGSITLDPNSSNFGKIKIGNTTFDVTGGMGSLVTLIARLTPQKRSEGLGWYSTNGKTGKTTKVNSGKYGAPTAWDFLTNFLEGKLSPSAGIARDVWKGQDFSGKPVTVSSLIKNAVAPIIIQNYNSLKNTPNSAPIIASMILDGLGISSSTYSTTTSSINNEFGKSPFGNDLIKEFDRLNSTGNKPTLTNPQDNKSWQGLKTQLGDKKYNKAIEDFKSTWARSDDNLMKQDMYKKASDEEKKNLLDKIKSEAESKIQKEAGYREPKAEKTNKLQSNILKSLVK